MEPMSILNFPCVPTSWSNASRIRSQPRIIWPSPTDVTPGWRLYMSAMVAASERLWASM